MTEKKYLGVDWGQKRIGLAIADGETKTAIPFGVVGSLEEVARVVKMEEITELVIGDPKEKCGGVSKLAFEFNNFVRLLEENTGLKAKLIDERFSSKAADALPGGKKDKAERDAVAAMLILDAFLTING